MPKVISRDGTEIAFEKLGAGPAVILVDGALCHRNSGLMRPIANALAQQFTVFFYDRRGRGESGNTLPYAVEREIEDVNALIQEAGGSACLFGVSSGAALALEAANAGLNIPNLALYEAPYIVDDTRPPVPDDYVPQLDALIAADRRSDAVKLFMKIVGVPAIFVLLMRFLPPWSRLKAVAHTLPYDAAIMGENQRGKPLPTHRWGRAKMPAIVIGGQKSELWMRNAVAALAKVLPNAQMKMLPGQTHMVKAEAVAPVLIEFFAG